MEDKKKLDKKKTAIKPIEEENKVIELKPSLSISSKFGNFFKGKSKIEAHQET